MNNRTPVLRTAPSKPGAIRYQMWGTAILPTCTDIRDSLRRIERTLAPRDTTDQ